MSRRKKAKPKAAPPAVATNKTKNQPPAPTEQVPLPLDLPPEVLAQLSNGSIQIQELYEGPYPHPELLRKFDDVVPGSAREIIDGVQDQRQHRQAMEAIIIKREGRLQFTGMACGLVAILAIVALAGLMVIHGYPVPAAIVGGGGLASIVYAFRRSEQKAEQAQQDAGQANPPAEKKRAATTKARKRR